MNSSQTSPLSQQHLKYNLSQTQDTDWNQVEISRTILAKSLEEKEPYEVSVCSRNYLVYPGVFSPKYFRSTNIFSSNIPFRREENFLEIGCGTGITSVEAALYGAKIVVATDISSLAVENTKLNARRFAVNRTIDTRQGDIFSSISCYEKFDTIYWNLPFIYVNKEFKFSIPEEKWIFDPGYYLAERFFKESYSHILPHGRLLIGFANFGNETLIKDIASNHGWVLRELMRKEITRNSMVEYILFEGVFD
jgi:methylase of polypeptide subunit release factors